MDKAKRKAYNQDYYKKNRERILRINKKWYDTHKKERTEIRRAYYKRTRETRLQYRRDYTKRLKEKIQTLLGNKCVVCGKTEKLVAHEIHGKPHAKRVHYILNHIEDFVLVCYSCHNGIHFCMKHLGLTLEQILEMVVGDNG